ncbi:FdrA family protein [Actinomadura scrupuli]|uniref:FdrA family protein n=1 Tax=Actinomadura scrupuli TaxID=559629 RepID=UPI003D98AE2F
MSTEIVDVRPGAYHDSVTLMRVGRTLADRDGVLDALTAMATELNLDLLGQLGFPVPAQAGPNDLVVAVRAVDQAAVDSALEALTALLSAASGPGAGAAEGGLGTAAPPRTTGSAATRGEASLALVSVPGQYAFAEAMDALTAGLNVMVFSDNVTVAQEIRLKDEAARRGLIVMGPDCGTAVIGGAGLGFANAVRPGPVGLVAASGTGSQQVMCLLDAAGVGISHALGVGGRDLSAEVSGRSTLQALAALDADPATELILVVSKPPAPQVADLIREAARRMATPTLFALLGAERDDLTSAVEKALGALGVPVPRWPCRPVPQDPVRGLLRGLFAGGTLCDEAMLIAASALGPIRSNIPLRPDWTLGPPGHTMIDFGDDEMTRGRAHPMIDPTLRLERLAADAADPSTGVLLLDVVLGYGAEPDPAALLAPAIEAARADRELPVVVSLCGTAADPQDLDRQATALHAAGAAVFASNAAAARHAVALIQGVPA